MRVTSRTGLLASPTKKVVRAVKAILLTNITRARHITRQFYPLALVFVSPENCFRFNEHSLPTEKNLGYTYAWHLKFNPHLKASTGPAPYTIKPYAGLYNPFSYGCSLLCNHPADGEARKMLKKAKENWTNDGKSFLFPDEVAAIRAGIEQIQMLDNVQRNHMEFDVGAECVPEELFRRYTEMDSRPLTPAPTLASAHTRASAARRCVTPDPIRTSEVREKTLLVLDLRRSHSQETLSWYGSNQPNDPPLIRVTHVGTRAPSPTARLNDKKKSPRNPQPLGSTRRPRSGRHENKNYLEPPEVTEDDKTDNEGDDEDDGETMKRRGKKRKKRARDSSRTSMFRTTTDPETLVATIGPESQNPSARPSLIGNSLEAIEELKGKLDSARRLSCLNVDSYLDYEMLRQLRRELTAEIVEFEFNMQRKKALQEAMKTVSNVKLDCDELITLKKDITLPVLDTDLVLSLPRMFTRSSARFELPMDSRKLNGMTPIQYLRDNVHINSTRKLLYNYIFNIFKIHDVDDIDLHGSKEEDAAEGTGIVKEARERKLSGEKFPEVLDIIMGGKLSPKQLEFIRELVGWSDDESYDFKVFCSISAMCERLLAKEFYQSMPDPSMDPSHEVERLDFEALERKLHNKTVDDRLVKILRLIKDS